MIRIAFLPHSQLSTLPHCRFVGNKPEKGCPKISNTFDLMSQTEPAVAEPGSASQAPNGPAADPAGSGAPTQQPRGRKPSQGKVGQRRQRKGQAAGAAGTRDAGVRAAARAAEGSRQFGCSRQPVCFASLLSSTKQLLTTLSPCALHAHQPACGLPPTAATPPAPARPLPGLPRRCPASCRSSH